MQKNVKRMATSLPLLTAVLLGSGSIYRIVNADDAVKGTANVIYTPGDTPITGDGWDIIIPTSYEFTAGNNPNGAKPGKAVVGVVRLTDPYGNTYTGDKTVSLTATSQNKGLLKDSKGNGNATYQLQDDKGTVLKDDGSAPVASLTKGKGVDSKNVSAAITKGERSKGDYSDILTFSASETAHSQQ